MKRVLYFTGYRMVAQEWSGHKLESSVYFEPDEQGLDLFTSYLRSIKDEPVRMLVDLIEEEFRQVRIPLLRGADRRSILNRNFAKYFRNSRYRFAISQGKEKKARKEELLLLIGLTNQYLLEPWLQVIDDTRTPLSGIISLPLLSEDYISRNKSGDKAIILVSQQVPSNLRQSVFVNGKLVLSRLVPIASFYQGDYASDVIRDIDSTQRYLASQRMIERSEEVKVQILTNRRHYEKLTIRCAQDDLSNYQIIEINDLLRLEKIEIYDDQDFSSGLFCYLASKKTWINHYARAEEKKYYRHHMASLLLKFASIGLLAVGLGLATTSAVKSWLYNSTVSEIALIEQKYKSKFNQLSENKIDSTTSTTSMQNIVQTVQEIEKNYINDPEKMLSMVSRDISLFSDIRVKRMEWFVSNISDTEAAIDVAWGKPKRQRKKKNKKTNTRNIPPPRKGLFEIALIEGEFLNFDGDYRYALSAVDDLEKTMMESGNYFSVEVTKRPLDIEPENRISGDASISRSGKTPSAKVAFRVVREVKKDE
ncbi:MAG: hypothetical protein ACC663_10815 [Gammaproteobacteria bacterium]